MKFDLIWKNIDKEISNEEKALLQGELDRDRNFSKFNEQAKLLDSNLSVHYSHRPDASFLTVLKTRLIDEFAIPELKFNYYPSAIFILVSTFLTLIFIASPGSINESISTNLTNYLPYFSLMMVMSFGGLLLAGMDILMKKKLDKS